MKPHKNRFIAITAVSVALTIPAFAADGTWNTTTSGALWTLNTNWVGSVIADGSGNTADFSQVDITGATTVNLSGNRTIGNLIFGDTNTGNGGSWILAGGGDVLTLAGGTPTITVNALGSPGDYYANATISAGIAGTSGLTKVGAGRLILAGGTANTLSGAITVNAGMLGIDSSASLQNVTSAITVASGATFDAKAGFGANITNNFTLSGTGSGISNFGTVYGALNIRENANLTGAITLAADTLITHDWNIATVSGSITGTNTNLELKTLQPGQYGFFVSAPISLGTGALTLTGVGTSGSPDFTLSGANSYTGGTLLKGGRVSINNASALGSGTVTFVSDTSLASTASMTHANAVTVNSGVAATLDVAASTTLDQTGAVTGAGSFIKSGLGTATLSGGTSNTLSGGIIVNAGMLGSLNSASLQNVTGAITVASGATFDAKAFYGAAITNNFTLSGNGSGINNYGALNIRENANLTGAITLAADTRITHDWNVAYVNASITGTNTNLELQTLQPSQYGFYMNGAISLGTGALTLTGIGTAGSPDFTLSGNNTFTGGVVINNGVVQLNSAGALNSTAGSENAVTFGASTTTGKLALNGGSYVISNLASNATPGSPVVENGNATAVTLTVGNSQNLSGTYAGVIQDGTGGGALSLTKSGTGTLTLSGSNAYTGDTAINAGILSIGNAAALGTTGTISFGGGTLQYNGIATDLSNRFSTAASQAYNVDTNGQNVIWASGLTSSGGTLTKSGAGTLVLSGSAANTFTGPITVSAGMLGILDSASLQNVTGAITVASGATFDAKAGFGASIANNFTLSGNGSGINNYGALNIRENATLTGAITLAADTRITHDWNIAFVNASITGTNTNLELQTLQAGQYGFYMNGAISLGTGSLTLTGIGTAGSADLELSGNNTFTGGVVINNGVVKLNSAGALNSTAGSENAVTFGAATTNGKLALNGRSYVIANLASNATPGSPVVENANATAVTLTVGNSQNLSGTYAGVIQDGTGGGTLSLTKSGTGTMTLSGTNTYTGATQVNAGKLLIGSSGSLASTAVTVGGSTATGTPTLGGGGTIGGATVIAAAGGGAAGTHAPGVAGVASGVGTQTFSSTLTYGSGSIFEWDLNAGTTDPGVATTNSGTYDQVVAGGSVSGTSVFQIVLGGNTFSSDFWNTDKSWNNIFTGGGVTTGTLQALFTTFSGAGVDSSGLVTGRGQFTFTSGNSLAWSAVPEPTSAVAGLLIAAGFLRRRRN